MRHHGGEKFCLSTVFAGGRAVRLAKFTVPNEIPIE